MLILRVAFTAAVLLCAAAGCSSSTGTPHNSVPSAAPTATAAQLGPCRLLDASDAAALAVGYPGHPTQTLDFGPSCDFRSVLLTVVDAKVSQSAFEYNSTRPVPGLGEQALYGADFHWLRVRTSSSRFEVRCVLCQTSTEVDTMTKIAQRVLTHVR